MIDLLLYDDLKGLKYSRMRVAAAVIVGGSSLLGAGASLYAGNEQADAAKDATAQSTAIQQKQYDTTRSDLAPYRQAGTQALSTIGTDLSTGTGFAKPFDFQADPGYQFTLDQGTKAVNNSAAARGGLLSGAAAKAIAKYTTGLADTTYGDAYTRYLQNRQQQSGELYNLANIGLGATGTTANAGANAANAESQNTMNGLTEAGNATASGAVGAANAIAAGAGQFAGYEALNKSGYSSNPYQTLYNAQRAPVAGPTNVTASGMIPFQSLPSYGGN